MSGLDAFQDDGEDQDKYLVNLFDGLIKPEDIEQDLKRPRCRVIGNRKNILLNMAEHIVNQVRQGTWTPNNALNAQFAISGGIIKVGKPETLELATQSLLNLNGTPSSAATAASDLAAAMVLEQRWH